MAASREENFIIKNLLLYINQHVVFNRVMQEEYFKTVIFCIKRQNVTVSQYMMIMVNIPCINVCY